MSGYRDISQAVEDVAVGGGVVVALTLIALTIVIAVVAAVVWAVITAVLSVGAVLWGLGAKTVRLLSSSQ